MKGLVIYCDEFDFSRLADAFSGEFSSDADLAAEVVFADEEEIRRLNRETRGVDAVTDVLSYPSLEGIKGKTLLKKDYPADIDENGNLFIGSVAICTQRAREQAEEYGHGYNRELHYLAAHGVCHLLGYDHIEEADKREMRALEERALGKIKITRD